VANVDRVSAQVAAGLSVLLGRIRALALVVAIIAGVIGLATFLTGMWVFDASTTWIIIGGIMCFAPVAAGLFAVWLVHLGVSAAGMLVSETATFLAGGRRNDDASAVLIDLDTGAALTMQSRTFTSLRGELTSRRRELPALYAGVKAVTAVPKLAAFTVLGMFGVGFLGFVLLIGGLID
jgi:hypothetical protein